MWSFVLFCFAAVIQALCNDNNDTSRIISGQETSIENHPYQVYIRFSKIDTFCGGFIISNDYIVSAAHCNVGRVDPPYHEKVFARAGSTYRSQGGIIIEVENMISHPQYGAAAKFDNDVTLIKTSQPIAFSKTIMPIRLPPANRALNGYVEVAGWGRTVNGVDKFPDRLMAVKIPILPRARCEDEFGRQFTKNMWCCGNFDHGGESACQGDSGGAAVQDNMAVGIVSFGRGCGVPRQPGVFANTASPSIRIFIHKHTGL